MKLYEENIKYKTYNMICAMLDVSRQKNEAI